MLVLDIIVGVLTLVVVPMLINKTSEARFEWVKDWLRELWCLIALIYTYYGFTRIGWTMTAHAVLGTRYPKLSYLFVGLVGFGLACVFWYVTGKLFSPPPVPTPSVPVKSPDQPTQPNPAPPESAKPPNGGHKERSSHAPQMFTEQEAKFFVTFGSNTLTVTDKYPAKFMDGVRAYVERGRLVLDAQLFSGSVNPVEVKANQLSLRDSEWDRNYDDTALEVVNQNGVPVLQVIYTTPHNVVIRGVFQTPQLAVAMSQARTVVLKPGDKITPEMYPVRRIFKYPSRKYLHQEE